MPFTARDLRYHPEDSYPLLYAYLHRNAQRFLGSLKYDAFEVDTVIGHVVEQLVRLGLFGGGDHTPMTALDHFTNAQFYAFLSRAVHNKAIDRLRRRHLQISTAAELEGSERDENDEDIIEDKVESVWGTVPFATPEEITLRLASQQELRALLKHCIQRLQVAPHQLTAVLQEMRECGADELFQDIADELHLQRDQETGGSHMSQHKDHAHKKLRHCLQQKRSNLTVNVALRLTEYTTRNAENATYTVTIHTLAQDDLSEQAVRAGLQALVSEGMLHWQGEDTVTLTGAEVKRLQRFYREE